MCAAKRNLKHKAVLTVRTRQRLLSPPPSVDADRDRISVLGGCVPGLTETVLVAAAPEALPLERFHSTPTLYLCLSVWKRS